MTCIIDAIKGCFCPEQRPTHRKGPTIEISASRVQEVSEVKDIQIGETMSVPMSRRESFQEERRRSN